MAHDNKIMAHIYAAFENNDLNIFLFISVYHSMVKRKVQIQFYTSR